MPEYKIVKLGNGGMEVLNSSMHSYRMEDGTEVPANPDVAKVLKSTFEEKVLAERGDVCFVQSQPEPTEEGLVWLAEFIAEHPECYVVTSFANLSAYKHPMLVGFIATPETSRVQDISAKRMLLNKMAQVLS